MEGGTDGEKRREGRTEGGRRREGGINFTIQDQHPALNITIIRIVQFN